MLKVDDWIQYVAINGQSQLGKVSNLVVDMNKNDTRVDLKRLNGQKDSIWINDDWVKAHPNMARLLDEKYREINNQSNDVQQRKRNEQNTKPDYYQFDDFEMYEIVEAICKHYNPVVAAWIGQAIQYIGRAPRKNGKEDIGKARDMIERAFEVWDK